MATPRPNEIGFCDCKLDHAGDRPHKAMIQCVNFRAAYVSVQAYDSKPAFDPDDANYTPLSEQVAELEQDLQAQIDLCAEWLTEKIELERRLDQANQQIITLEGECYQKGQRIRSLEDALQHVINNAENLPMNQKNTGHRASELYHIYGSVIRYAHSRLDPSWDSGPMT